MWQAKTISKIRAGGNAVAEAERVTLRGAGLDLAADRWDPDGPARGEVFLLHGGGQTRGSWKHTGRRLAARGWTTFALDARGHGDSDWSDTGDYTADAHLADVRAAVSARPAPPVLVGASMGGYAALLAAGEHSGIAAGLVLVDIAVSAEPAGLARVQGFMHAGLDGFDSVEAARAAVSAYNPHRAVPPSSRGLLRNLRERDGRWYWHWDPAMIDERNLAAQAPERRERRARRAAGNVAVPTMLVRGAQSDIVTPAAAVELLELIPSLRYVDIAGTGHMVSGDDNDVFTEAVVTFLDAMP